MDKKLCSAMFGSAQTDDRVFSSFHIGLACCQPTAMKRSTRAPASALERSTPQNIGSAPMGEPALRLREPRDARPAVEDAAQLRQRLHRRRLDRQVSQVELERREPPSTDPFEAEHLLRFDATGQADKVAQTVVFRQAGKHLAARGSTGAPAVREQGGEAATGRQVDDQIVQVHRDWQGRGGQGQALRQAAKASGAMRFDVAAWSCLRVMPANRPRRSAAPPPSAC